ncbi:MAG TPA: DNA recombination protein RmuC [Deltaproteobacteria bacterium]|nr:DNA recombination protein RmuC [Deltaproteobacteria bacterium]
MEPESLVLVAAAAAAGTCAVLAATFLLRRRRGRSAGREGRPDNVAAALELMGREMSRLSEQVTGQLSAVTSQLQVNTGQVSERMEAAARVFGEVKEGIGSLRAATGELARIGRDISSLQEILGPPKLRGGLGEFLLSELLAMCLPPSAYELEYAFSDGLRVDAVVKLSAGLVPVDSKFPLESFRRLLGADGAEAERAARRGFARDVRRHIDKIASSYIRPDESTMTFAVMYVPAENVYYETIVRGDGTGEDLVEYAMRRKVVPVSPQGFYMYLNTVALGLKGLELSERTGRLWSRIERLSDEYGRLCAELDVMGRHLANAKNRYDAARSMLVSLGERIEGLSRSDGRG